jgi:hypothetical protein
MIQPNEKKGGDSSMAFSIKGSKMTGKPAMGSSGTNGMKHPVTATPAPAPNKKVAAHVGRQVGPVKKNSAPAGYGSKR